MSILDTTQLNDAIRELDDIKTAAFPSNVDVKKICPGKLGKKELTHARALLRSLVTKIDLLNRKIDKKTVKQKSSTPRVVRVTPQLASLLGLSSGHDLYSNHLLSSYFTNYFYLNNLVSKVDGLMVVVPDSKLVELFKAKFIEDGIVDTMGRLVERSYVNPRNGKCYKIRGFPYIHYLKYVNTAIVEGAKDKLTPELSKFLGEEKKRLQEMSGLRKQIKKLEEDITKLKSQTVKAQQLGDSSYNTKSISDKDKQIGRLRKQLRDLCDDNGFPVSF